MKTKINNRLLTILASVLSITSLQAADVTLSVGFSSPGGTPPAVTWTLQSQPTGAVVQPTINQKGPTPGTGYTHTAIATLPSNSTPGTYVFRATATSGTLSSFSDATVTVMASQTITFGALPVKAAKDADFSPGATASSGLPITYTSSNTAVATIVNNQVHVVGVGSTVITASQGGNATYAAATDVTQTLTVNTASQLITFPVLATKTIGDADFAPGATVDSGLALTYKSSNTSVATIVNNQVHIIAAGTSTITATQNGNSNYAATSASQTLTVNKKAQTITFAGLASVQVGAADITPSVSASSGLAVTLASSNTAVATIVNGKIHVVGNGQATITASQPGDATWAAAPSVSQTLSVGTTAQAPTVTAPAVASPNVLILP